MADTTENDETSGPRRWLKLVLIVSVSLNLLVVGLIGGSLLADRGDHRANRILGPMGLRGLAQGLTDDQRERLHDNLRARRPDIRATHVGLRANLDALETALRADPFDLEAVKRLLEEQRAALGSQAVIGHAVLIEMVGGMSADERVGFADNLAKAIERRRQRRKNHAAD